MNNNEIPPCTLQTTAGSAHFFTFESEGECMMCGWQLTPEQLAEYEAKTQKLIDKGFVD